MLPELWPEMLNRRGDAHIPSNGEACIDHADDLGDWRRIGLDQCHWIGEKGSVSGYRACGGLDDQERCE